MNTIIALCSLGSSLWDLKCAIWEEKPLTKAKKVHCLVQGINVALQGAQLFRMRCIQPQVLHRLSLGFLFASIATKKIVKLQERNFEIVDLAEIGMLVLGSGWRYLAKDSSQLVPEKLGEYAAAAEILIDHTFLLQAAPQALSNMFWSIHDWIQKARQNLAQNARLQDVLKKLPEDKKKELNEFGTKFKKWLANRPEAQEYLSPGSGKIRPKNEAARLRLEVLFNDFTAYLDQKMSKKLCAVIDYPSLKKIPKFLRSHDAVQAMKVCPITKKPIRFVVAPKGKTKGKTSPALFYEKEALTAWAVRHPGINPPSWPRELTFSIENVAPAKQAQQAINRTLKAISQELQNLNIQVA